MADSINPNANNGTSSNFLPKYFQTDANKKFLQATIDQLVQPGTVNKINGYIGRKNAKASTGDDIFIAAANSLRQNYQLEPGLIVNDKLGANTFFKDYQDYINQLNVFGSNTGNHARLNKQEFYSWDPHIDWDKFVNFQHYYWLPFGPDVVTIAGNQEAVVSTYTVTVENEGDNNAYIFQPNGLTRNPTLQLFRGQTYRFNITSKGNPFSIKTLRTQGSQDRYIDEGLSSNAIESGVISFTIPFDAPDVLYYVSETDADLGGVFQVLSIDNNTSINVETEVLGKATYTLSNGASLSNGMKVRFIGNVQPASYASGYYYVEGVGTSIKLVNESDLELISGYTNSEEVLFDNTPFDSLPFSDATAFAGTRDYIVINRGARDHNPWARYNRWFHRDTIEASAEFNGHLASIDQSARAVRPIIEFEAGLKLFNFGTTAIADVDLVDTFTTDVFSTIEGQLGYNIDGINLADNQRILFTADTDRLVKGKIYRVKFVSIQGVRQIHLELETEPTLNDVVLVRQGLTTQGQMYWYDGDTWHKAQQKSALNQAPLFDVVDSDGVSYGDISTYEGTTFKGTKIFSYKVGTGTADSNLGFALSYKNINNIGDILFTFDLANDTFQYKKLTDVLLVNVNIGYLQKTLDNGNTVYQNGWQICEAPYVQAAVRIYKNSNKTNNFDIDIFDALPAELNLDNNDIRVYVNSKRVAADHWTLATTSAYHRIVFNNDVSTTDIVMIKVFCNTPINANGYYEIPVNLQNNPLNDAVVNFTLGEVIDHVDSIIDNIYQENVNGIDNLPTDKNNGDINGVTYIGVFPGTSNLRNLGNITRYGTKFVQHSGPASLSMYHITSDTNNIVRAIEASRDDYNKFKRNFVAVAEVLGVDADPITLVDLVLQKINKDKPPTFPYYFSDMVPYGANTRTDLIVVDYRIRTYPLSQVFNLDTLSNKAVCVYHNGNQLLVTRDYTFSDQGFIVITPEVTLANDDAIVIYEYENTNGCFVPATPTKLGIWPKYEPKIYEDTSLITPRTMIQGHDGSQVLAYGDYRDELILELEKRIYNNIKVKYDAGIFDIYDVIPSYNRTNDYSLAEFNTALAPSFYKWASLVDRDFTKPLSYDRNNPMTFNYRGHTAPDGRETPGYWRGVYRWLLDTDRPNICPWEMLGITEEPTWWTTVYGEAPYTSNNLPMWKDLADGVVREPGKAPVFLAKFKRPYLVDHIPVDEAGNITSPLMSGLSTGIITYATTGDFVFGDVSPVEAAWRRSSHYSFSVLLTAMLLQPAKTFGTLLDRSRIVRNIAGQLVYSETGLRIRPADIMLPSIYSSTEKVETAGIINYLVDYILSDNLKSYQSYAYDLSNLDARITYRIGGFTSKEKFNLLLDSKTPLSQGSVFVPQEDYDIILNSSSPVRKVTYSGAIITKLSDGYSVKGYSKTQPYFYYYAWTKTGIPINVGGISESYTTWAPDSQYAAGKLVQYGNKYYRVKALHISTDVFNAQYYQALPSLPIIGGRDAILRTTWDRTDPIVVPYGTKFRTVQEVVDFLLGYGEYLKDQGFIFDDFNTELAAVTNWETSAKEFLFWTTQNWSTGEDKWDEWVPNNDVAFGSIVRYNGDYYRAIRASKAAPIFVEDDFVKLDGLSTIGSSVISLSPAAAKLTLSTDLCVVDDIRNPFNGYEIFKVDGTPIDPNFLNSYRKDNAVSYSPQGADGIFGASFYLVQKEQVVVLNNTTMFNDTIYNLESGYRQERIKVSGYVSTNWYGGFDVPGFIFDQADIQQWSSWTDYALGDIVKYKEFYYSASKFLPGAQEFSPQDWVKLSKKPTAQLLPNWSYKASQFTDFYSLDSDNFDPDQQKLAQHLVGYQKRQYLENIIKDDVSEFKFYQGMIVEKGTQNVLNKLFDVLSADGQESLTFYEEWALRVGQYGANASFENIEFVLDESEFKNNPQGFELVQSTTSDNTSDFIIRQTPNDVYLKPLGYSNSPWPLVTNYNSFLRTPGYVRPNEVAVTLNAIEDILTYSVTQFTTGDYIWCGFEGREWNVYRYTASPIKVTDVTYDSSAKQLTVTTSVITSLKVGDIISIDRTTKINGFYKIESVSLNSFVVSATIASWATFTEQNVATIFTIISQRAASIDDADQVFPALLQPNELVWTDDAGNGKWATWKYNTVYSESTIPNRAPSAGLEYGRAMALSRLNNILAVLDKNGQVYVYDRPGFGVAWVSRQLIPITDADAVAVSDDNRWLAVSNSRASDVNSSGLTSQGVVYIYEKDANNIFTLNATFVSPDAADNGYFGSSLLFTKNNVLLVGSVGYDPTPTGSFDNNTGQLYQVEYSIQETPPSAYYNPSGSNGTTIKVSSTTGIASGMVIVGNGFSKGQAVASVVDDTTIILDAAPDSAVSGQLLFTVKEWKYPATPSMGTTQDPGSRFGSVLSISKDASTLLVSAPESEVLKATADYVPQGSSNTLVELDSTAGIDARMYVRGEGFVSNQYVTMVIDSTHVLLSAGPDSVPFGALEFVSKVGKVHVYKLVNGSYELAQTIEGIEPQFGASTTISDASSYIAVSSPLADKKEIDQGNVSVYKYNGSEYVKYQDLTNARPEAAELFGSKVAFMNDYKTLVVYSQNADSTLPWELTDGTTFDNLLTSFYLSKNVNGGRVDVYDCYSSKWIFSESLINDNVSTADYGASLAVQSNVIMIGAPHAIDQGLKSGKVYEYTKPINAYSWSVLHAEIEKPDVSKIKQAFLYNRTTNKLVTYLDVLDSNQGRIPGIADQEIKYKTYFDPATYNDPADITNMDSSTVTINGSPINVDNGQAWGKAHVGMLWWDLRTAKFYDSYDSDIVYRNSTWNTLFSGASIDVYEWVQSQYLPADRDKLADTEAGLAVGISGTALYGNSVYSYSIKYDTVSKTQKKTYYYWVKNKKTIPNVPFRKLSCQDVANLISNPRGQGYKYLALTSANSFSLVNVKPDLQDTDIVLSVEYWTVDKTDRNIHTEWKLVNDSVDTVLPATIEQKWFDSLCGKDSQGRLVPDTSLPIKLRYGVENRPRQSMFVNRFEALKQVIEQTNRVLIKYQIAEQKDISLLQSFEAEPSTITGLYDAVLDTDAELRFAKVGSFKQPTITPVIENGKIVDITIVAKGNGYLSSPVVTVHGTGTGAIIKLILNTSGQIIGADVIKSGQGYNENTTLLVRNYSVLVHSDSSASGSWSIYSYDPLTTVWSRMQSQSYDTTRYWKYVDWFATGYNSSTASDYAVSTLADINSLSTNIGQIVKVLANNNSSWMVLRKYADSTSVDWTQSYEVIGLQNGTLQFDASLYQFTNTSYGYDGSLYDGSIFDNSAEKELRNILVALKNNILTDELKQDYLDLFFTSVRYALSEQNYLDWIFKTSFVKVQHNVGELKQKVTYNNDNLSDFESYVDEVKPYRTTIREYVSNYSKVDTNQLSVTDFDMPPVFDNGKLSMINAKVVNGVIQSDNNAVTTYPWKHWLDNVGFSIVELKIVDGGSGYITEPVVRFTSSTGTNATARAFIANGKINRVVLTNVGSGYLRAPTVTIDGGLSVDGTAARVVAIIGNSVIRSSLIKMKFDRVTQTYFMTSLDETESFTGTGSRVQFPLKWAPDRRIGKSSVTVNGVDILRDDYTLTIAKSTSRGYTSYSGVITFDIAPAKNTEIVVSYIKDWSLLNAADRIQHYYDPATGELGKDLAQLMTGVDYGGVIVNGMGFDVSYGWDSLPFYSDKWDSFDATFDDYIVTVGANTHTFTLPYTPEEGTELNVYCSQLDSTTYQADGTTVVYYFSVFDIYPPAVTVSRDVAIVDSVVEYVSTASVAVNVSGADLSRTISVSSTDGLVVGMTVSGTGIASGAVVAEIYGLIVTLTLANIGTVSGQAIFGNNAIVVSDTSSIEVGMTISGTGFVSGQTVIEVVDATTVIVNADPTATPVGTMFFTNNIAGTNILHVESTAALRIGDVVSVLPYVASTVGYDTKVISIIDDNRVKLNQILFNGIAGGSVATFTRKLITPSDCEIETNGTITLTSPVEIGSALTVSAFLTPVRLDDANFGTVDASSSAIMLPIISTGVSDVGANTYTVSIPEEFAVNNGDQFIIRKSTSDGSIKPQEADYDTSLSGGSFTGNYVSGVFTSATGLAADDIIVDGDDFVSPTTSPATEEVVPGQVVDAVSIKVYDRPRSGSATMKVSSYLADGETTTFAIGQQMNSPQALIVKTVYGDITSNATLQTVDVDYTVDYNTGSVVFDTAPDVGYTVSIFSFGFNGSGILDIDYFIGDSTTNEFITKASWESQLDSLIYVNGQVPAAETVELFRTDSTYENSDRVGIRFSVAPAAGDLINFVIVNSLEQSFAITKTERIATNGSDTYDLSNIVGDTLPAESNMLVRVDQSILAGPNNSYYSIKNGKKNYKIDTNKYLPYAVSIEDIRVYANGILLNVGVDYTVDLGGITVIINQITYDAYYKGTLIISINQNAQYTYIPATDSDPAKIQFAEAYDNTHLVEVITSYKHDILDIQRTAFTVTSNTLLAPSQSSTYVYTGFGGGYLHLDRPVISDDYVWIVKNGTLLTPSVDFKLLSNYSSVKFAEPAMLDDEFTIITFSSNVLKASISYMQFKDMLNRTHFKRLNLNKQTTLAIELKQTDVTITVADASNFSTPSPANNKPGIIEIRGERIEYFSKVGNVLGQLRRGTLGTGTPAVHAAGSFVQDISASETIPYSDTSVIDNVVSDGTDLVSLGFVPAGFNTTWTYCGRSMTAAEATSLTKDAAEVFAAGTRLKKNPYSVYGKLDGGTIVAPDYPESPEGDISFDAEFAIDNTNVVQLTTTPVTGTTITVVKRVGTVWDSTINIQDDTSKIATFLKAEPGIWYNEYKKS